MPRLTRPLLKAIWAALDAALAGDGFDGGDFAGMNPDYFRRARDWADAQLDRGAKRPDTEKALIEDSLPILEVLLDEREEATGEKDEIVRDLVSRIRAKLRRAK